MKSNNYSTIDLHNIKQDIYLGFLSEQNLTQNEISYSISYFGGEPTWLYPPSVMHSQKQNTKNSIYKCSTCQINLCFMAQIYCPFDADYCYHRVLYILFCNKCQRQFKCLRQQAKAEFVSQITDKQNNSKIRKVCQPRELLNEPYSKNQFIQEMNRAKMQIEEDKAIQQAQSEQQQDITDQIVNAGQLTEQQLKRLQIQDKKQTSKKQKIQIQDGESMKKVQNQDLDVQFQVYKKMIKQLDNPCLLYTDIALPYNKMTLNPQHFCKSCGSKLLLQIQITEKALNMDNSVNPSSNLFMMDWGSIMIYTCSASCTESLQQCVVVQYQANAIKQEDIKKLKKNKKNKKKKQKRSKSKSDSKSKSKDKNKQIQSSTEKKQNEKSLDHENKKQINDDWD